MSENSNSVNNISIKQDRDECPSVISSPCVYSCYACREGCNGCVESEKHHVNYCIEIMFCCIPFTLVIDTVCLFVTLPKWIYQKKCKK
jgi:hypothetical protein